MSIKNVTILEPYKILSFTHEGVNDQGFSFEVSYELVPSYKGDDGIWINTNESMFDQQEVKDFVSAHLVLWNPELISAYVTYFDSTIPKNPSLEEQINTILASL